MPTVSNFSFQFEKPDKTYCPGETVRYKVTFTVNQWTRSSYLKLCVAGGIKLTNRDTWCNKFYNKYEKIVFTNEIDPGVHTFLRSFQLPENLPASLKFQHGLIEYSISVSLLSPHNRYVAEEAANDTFFVKYQRDLNSFPDFMNSIYDTQKTEFTGCFSWYKSEPLRVTTILPKTLYTLGETIPITVEINNSSDVAVKYTDVFVMEKLEFHSFKGNNGYPFRFEDINNLRVIFHKRFDTVVLPLQVKIIQAKCLPTRIHNLILSAKSSIFDCSYYVVVKVVVRGFYTGITNQSQIVITDDYDDLPSYEEPFETYCLLDYYRQMQYISSHNDMLFAP